MEDASFARIVLRLAELLKSQQVEIRVLRARIATTENTISSQLDTDRNRDFRKNLAGAEEAAQGATQGELTGLISELRALLPKA
jgi:hypothetical protein